MKVSSSTKILFLGLIMIGFTNPAPAAQFWKDLYEPTDF